MDVGSYIVARKIFSTYCLPTIDLFASGRNKQVNQSFSTDRHDPHALGIDALQQSWDFKNQLLYAFPPTGVIPLVLRRVYKLSSQMILVTPWWPRAPWLPELIRLSVRLPFRLPESLDTILNLTTNRTLPDYHKLHMMVWLISAQPSDSGGGGGWLMSLKWPDFFKTIRFRQDSLSRQFGVAERALMQLPLLS